MKYVITESQHNRLISEDIDSRMGKYFRRRLPDIEEAIYREMDENDPNDFKGEYEYANNIISWVVQGLEDFDYDTMDEYQLRDLIKEYFGEMVIDYYLNNADDDDEFFGFDDDEL